MKYLFEDFDEKYLATRYFYNTKKCLTKGLKDAIYLQAI